MTAREERLQRDKYRQSTAILRGVWIAAIILGAAWAAQNLLHMVKVATSGLIR